jgi:hypothetical protein
MQDFMITDLREEEVTEEQLVTEVPPRPAPVPRPARPPGFPLPLWLVLVVIVLAVALLAWRRRPRVPGGLVIREPKLGFLNLLGEEGDQLLAEDRPALAPLFASVQESRDLPPPACDVLVVYCDLSRDGSIFATEIGLRKLAQRARARILILASENKSDYCLTAAQEAAGSGANLVLTMARNGAEFPELLARLFADMKTGTPMPEAYNRLAPRGKIFLADAGELVFAGGAGAG